MTEHIDVDSSPARVLLAAPDTLHFSADTQLSDDLYERLERVEQVRHRVPMLLGIFSARGVLPLHLRPAYNVADLLLQHLDDLEAEADEKDGVAQILDAHFAKVYKVAAPPELFTSSVQLTA
ncbi:MAG: hypothetical protein ACLQUY_20325 [Ktedonobacterales bacterium]